MRIQSLICLVGLVLSTHLACGDSSGPSRRDSSTPSDSPGQETYAQPDVPIAIDSGPDLADIVDAHVDGPIVDGAVIDGAMIDGGNALVVPSDRMEIMLGGGCFEPQAVTVTNVSGDTLPPIRVSLEGPSDISFRSSGCTGESLQAGQTCSLQFALAAAAVRQRGPGQADLVIQAGSNQARVTLTWRGAMVGDNMFSADFGSVVVGSGPVLRSFPYPTNPLLQQQYASSIALRPDFGSSSVEAFSIVPNPDDCTQGPPRGESCILQIAFEPPAPQAYEASVVGGAGCIGAFGSLWGKGVRPYDGGVLDAGAQDLGQGQDLGPGLDATTTDQALELE